MALSTEFTRCFLCIFANTQHPFSSPKTFSECLFLWDGQILPTAPVPSSSLIFLLNNLAAESLLFYHCHREHPQQLFYPSIDTPASLAYNYS